MKPIPLILQPKQLTLGQLIYKTGPDVATWIGGGGARAGGKSGGLRRVMLDRRMQRPGTSGVIVRRTFKDVNENHIQKYFSEFPELIPYWRATDNEFRLPNKSRLCFRYYENKQAVDQGFWGPEWYDVFIDQAEQFTEYEMTIARSACRWPGAPMNDCKLGLFFNPGGVGTEFLRRIFHQRRFNANENPANYSFTHLFGWDNYVWFESLGISPKRFYALPDGVRAGDDCPAGAEGDRDGGYRCCRFHLFIHGTAEGQKLNALPQSLRAGHLLGSFDSFAGQYFAGVWDESKLILTAQQEVNLIQPWWVRWMAHDDGFVHHAALGWFVSGKVSPKLFMQVFGVEIFEPVTVVVIYRDLVKAETEPGELIRQARKLTSLEEARTLNRYFLSVDAWEKDSKGHSVAEEIEKELSLPQKMQASGKELVVTFPRPEQADNARVGGWRYLYAMMKKTADVLEGKMSPTRDNDDYDKDGSGGYSKDTALLFVSGTCQDIIEAIPMAIRDDIHKGKGEDIVKLPTKADDILDCFTAHTRIRTEHGERYICDIKAGERVWTRKGLKKVTASWMSRVGAPVVKLSFSRGESPILCTPAHRFWTQRGWIPAHSLRYDDQLVLWHSLFSKDENTRLFPAATTERQTDSFTAKCGSFITALSCLSWTRLIRMIWSVLRLSSMRQYTSQTANRTTSTWPTFDLSHHSGTAAKRAEHGTARTAREENQGGPIKRAINAVKPFLLQNGASSVPTTVGQLGGEQSVPTMSRGGAVSAGNHSFAGNMTLPSAAGDSAVRLAGYETAGFADVYDLEVEDAHEFFANGILVHNCIRYGCKSALRAKVTPFPVAAAEKRQEMQQLGLSMTEIAIQLKKLQAGNKERHIRKGSFR